MHFTVTVTVTDVITITANNNKQNNALPEPSGSAFYFGV